MFLPSESLGSEKDMITLKENMHIQSTESPAISLPDIASGLEKQYAVQRDLFGDQNQAHGEYVRTFRPVRDLYMVKTLQDNEFYWALAITHFIA